jgi:hypothetical protein
MLVLVIVIDVHANGVGRSIRANTTVEHVKLLMQADVVLL